MGQYHIVCNLTKREYLHAHDFGDGLKLLEFGADGGGTMLALALLLAASNGRGGGDYNGEIPGRPLIGSWAGDSIAIIGDYHEPDDVPGRHLPAGFYETVTGEQDGWRNLSAEMRPYIERVMGWTFTSEQIEGWNPAGEVTDRWTFIQKPKEFPRSLRPDIVIDRGPA